MIRDAQELRRAIATLTPPFALDTETTGLSPWEDKITLCVVGDSERAYTFAPELAGEILSFPQPLILQNWKFDAHMLYHAGVDIRGMQFQDTMLLHHLYDENAGHGLGDIVLDLFGDDYKRKFWEKYPDITKAPEAEVEAYAKKDAVYTRKVYEYFAKDWAVCRLQDKQPLIDRKLSEHVHKLAAVLFNTELEGLSVDLPYLVDLGKTLQPLIAQAKLDMQDAAPAAIHAVRLDQHAKLIQKAYTPKGKKWKTLPFPEFNWNSHQQLASLLYDKLALPRQFNVDKKTREQKTSTDDTALERLEALHALPKRLREYSTYQKVYSAFIEGTLERVRESRIYPSFNVNGTVTGRISAQEPNLQQLPASGEWGKVRGIYCARPGYCLISCDYSQLEVVIAAHFSRDPNLLRIVLGGESKHDITAAALRIPRGIAKTVNFAMQYGCGPGKVAEIMGLPAPYVNGRKQVPQAAKTAWNTYWATYCGEARVRDECAARVREGLAIITPWGRRRHFPTEFDEKWQERAAERQAYSALIQGTGADCTHWAFYTVDERLRKRGWGHALLEVHDEILIEVKEECATQAQNLLVETMVEAGKQISLSVPLKAEVKAPNMRWVK